MRKLLRKYVFFWGNMGIRHGNEPINLKWGNLKDYIDYVNLGQAKKASDSNIIHLTMLNTSYLFI